MTISNTDDTIDSRDIIERLKELEELIAGESTPEDFLSYCQEYDNLVSLAEEASYSPDWKYGETLIHRDYFKTYMDEMIRDCYELPELPRFMIIMLDYDALEQDYFSVDFDGQEFLIRC